MIPKPYPAAVSQTVTGLVVVLAATIATWFHPGWGLFWGWLIWINAMVLIAHGLDGVRHLCGSTVRLTTTLYGALALLGGTPTGWLMNLLLKRPAPTGAALMVYHALLVVQGILLVFAVWGNLLKPLIAGG